MAEAQPKAQPKKVAPARPKKAAPKPATPAAPRARPSSAPGGPAASKGFNPYDVVLHPVVTEKTMFNMDANNSLEFLVGIRATKPEIKRAVEELFTCKVARVNTRITNDGKRAVVRFAEGFSAEDIGMRIGVF